MNIKNDLKKLNPEASLGFVGAFIAIIAIFLFIPLFVHNHYANLMLQLGFTGLVLTIIYALKTDPRILALGVFLLTPFLIFDALGITYQHLNFFLIAYGFLSLFLFFAILLLLKVIFSLQHINVNLIFGTILIYLLVGVLWGEIFLIVEALIPQSFHGVEGFSSESGLEVFYINQFDLLYYSFSTLTTLGLGDIYPLHRLAKSLTLLEAIFGQLFIAIVIAKVVSVWRNQS